MPDLVSHAIIGLLLCELLNIKPKSLVVLGALLPDLLSKFELLHLFFPFGDRLYWILMPLHTPIGLILATFLVIHFFNYNKKRSYILITLGWVSHILADWMINRHLYIGSFLWFPFSWKTSEIGIAWPEEFYLVLIPLVAIYLLIRFLKRISDILPITK